MAMTPAGNNRRTILFFFVLFGAGLLQGLPGHASSGFRFGDPLIPDQEQCMYESTSENKTMLVHETVRTIRRGGREYYEITSLSPVFDSRVTINRQTMSVVSVNTVQKHDNATLDSTLIVRDERPSSRPDAITVPHFVALTHLLRGYPFVSRRKLNISYYGGTEKNKFNLAVVYKKREYQRVNDRDIECHKLEFGLDGFLGSLLPELELWYAVAPPHYLVRYSGPEGPPGTPKREMRLLQYQTPIPGQAETQQSEPLQ